MPKTIQNDSVNLLNDIYNLKGRNVQDTFDLIQRPPEDVFSELGVDTSDLKYRSTRKNGCGKHYKSLMNMKRWKTVDVLKEKIASLPAAAAAQSPDPDLPVDQAPSDLPVDPESPVANIGGFAAVAGGVPGATPGAASLGDAAPADVVPQFFTPQHPRHRLPAAQTPQMDHTSQLVLNLRSQFYQDLTASHKQQAALTECITEQLLASNAAHKQQLTAHAEQQQQQMMTFAAKTDEKFKEQQGMINSLDDTVADLKQKFGDLEKQVNSNKRVSISTRTHVREFTKEAPPGILKGSAKKRKSVSKDDQSTPTQPVARSTRSRSAQGSTPVSKRTTRSMYRKNEM